MTLLPNAKPRTRYVPFHALALSNEDGHTFAVNQTSPLPVTQALAACDNAPLAGSAATAVVAGPFVPVLGRPIWLTLGGTWSGRVRLLRSTDGGATMHALTIAGEPWANFTANATEPVLEETVAGATYYLDIAPTAGTVTYEVAQ